MVPPLRFGVSESHHGPRHWREPETALKPVTIGPAGVPITQICAASHTQSETAGDPAAGWKGPVEVDLEELVRLDEKPGQALCLYDGRADSVGQFAG
jgi:hypothetical protein